MMKKHIALLLTISCLFCLVGCGSFGVKDYEAKDKVFEFQDLKITLTEAFELDEEEADSVWYESSSETSVSIDKYPLSNTDKELGLGAYILAEETRKDPPYRKVSELKTDNGLIYLECEVESLGFEFLYFMSFYESENALWVVYFMCDLEDYDVYKEHFIKWAQSVVIDQ
jgi:hypothetical protein